MENYTAEKNNDILKFEANGCPDPEKQISYELTHK